MFKKKNQVGIYFGSNGVSIVETAGKGTIKNHVFSVYPKDIPKPSGTLVPQDNIFNVFLDNEEEIIAFLNKSMRESRIDIDNSDIVVSVPNRDLIVRFFEIPPIPKKELETSIGFEIKKYIPFKIEEIAFDYQTHSQKNIIEVLFAGIKKEDLEKYTNILKQLKINPLAVEPSQFSLLRLLKLEKIVSSKESVVVVELERSEGAISIVDNTSPCFSRDVKLYGGTDSGEMDIETLSFRLVNEVRVSIDYFRRQFLKKGIDKIIVLSKDESKELINNFNKELGISVAYYNPDNLFGSKEEYTLSLSKALGAAFRVSKPSALLINLSKRQKDASAGESTLALPQQVLSDTFAEIMDLPKPLIIKTVVMALLVLAAVFFLGNLRLKPSQEELAKVTQEADSLLSEDLKNLDKKSLEALKNKAAKDLKTYRRVFVNDLLVYEKLSSLPELLPEGVWLHEIDYDRRKKIIYLSGTVYRPSERESGDAPYVFISNLKESPLFSNNVKSIAVTSLKNTFVKAYKVIEFDIEVRVKR